MTSTSAHPEIPAAHPSDTGPDSGERMTADHRLSVVIPTLNEERSIGPCLASIGPEPQVEVVVSDGGSSDRTLEVVAATRPDALIIAGSPGRGGQLNRGAALASGERLLFLHADCVLPELWFPPLMTALDDEPTALACFKLQTEPAEGGSPGRWRRLWLSFFDLRSHGLGLPYGDQGFAVRRAVFELLGGFPDIPLMEDFAFARTCRSHGRIERLPMAVRTTARRFERHPVKARLILATFPTLFRLGVKPSSLARWYGVVR